MAVYYLDTSALVKLYHLEPGSAEMDRLIQEPGAQFPFARLTLTETLSVLAKKVRVGEIVELDFDRARLRFLADVARRVFQPLRMFNSHFDRAGEIVARHGKTRQVGALDALQLAAAMLATGAQRVDTFVCADRRLCDTARLEGLTVFNPESP